MFHNIQIYIAVYISVWNFCWESKVHKTGNESNEAVCLRPGKWRNERKSKYERNIDVCKVNELRGNVDRVSVDDVSEQLKRVLIDPACKTFTWFSKKYIKSNNTKLAGYDKKKCYKSRREYDKAKQSCNIQCSEKQK